MLLAPLRFARFGGLVVPGQAVEHCQASRDKYYEHVFIFKDVFR